VFPAHTERSTQSENEPGQLYYNQEFVSNLYVGLQDCFKNTCMLKCFVNGPFCVGGAGCAAWPGPWVVP